MKAVYIPLEQNANTTCHKIEVDYICNVLRSATEQLVSISNVKQCQLARATRLFALSLVTRGHTFRTDTFHRLLFKLIFALSTLDALGEIRICNKIELDIIFA